MWDGVSLTDQTKDWKILEIFFTFSSEIFSGLIALSFIYLADNENILFSGLLVSQWRMMVAGVERYPRYFVYFYKNYIMAASILCLLFGNFKIN